MFNVNMGPMFKVAYCDYIAHKIKKTLNEYDFDNNLITSVESPKMDLHPEGGYLVSTKKKILCEDINGVKYRITVEEV
jgi:hypothetical protein